MFCSRHWGQSEADREVIALTLQQGEMNVIFKGQVKNAHGKLTLKQRAPSNELVHI